MYVHKYMFCSYLSFWFVFLYRIIKEKDDNVHIEVHWQDGDSSANSLRVYNPDKTKTRVMLCGEHVYSRCDNAS